MTSECAEQAVSIAQVKRLLPPNKEFIAEFIGRANAYVRSNIGITSLVRPADERIERRRVLKQTHQMISLRLTGPKAGEKIYLRWRGVTARQTPEGIVLTMHDNLPEPEDFLLIKVNE